MLSRRGQEQKPNANAGAHVTTGGQETGALAWPDGPAASRPLTCTRPSARRAQFQPCRAPPAPLVLVPAMILYKTRPARVSAKAKAPHHQHTPPASTRLGRNLPAALVPAGRRPPPFHPRVQVRDPAIPTLPSLFYNPCRLCAAGGLPEWTRVLVSLSSIGRWSRSVS